MAEWTGDEVVQAMQKVRTRAAEDEAYCREVLGNPNRALEQVVGKSLPEGVTIQAVTAPRDTFVLVLPAFGTQEDELSDADLMQVAGGMSSGFYIGGGAGLGIGLVSGVVGGALVGLTFGGAGGLIGGAVIGGFAGGIFGPFIGATSGELISQQNSQP